MNGSGCTAGVPFSDVNLRSHKVAQPVWTRLSSLSEVSSLDLEFTFLGRAAASRCPPPLLPASGGSGFQAEGS